MGYHPKPIDELIFVKLVKTTNQSFIISLDLTLQ